MERLIVLLLLLTPWSLWAQTPIAEARDLPIGTQVTVRGVVTNGGELGSIRFLQDVTGGIAVFPGTGSVGGFSPATGTDISVSGTLKLFNGLLEIDPISAFTVHGTGLPLPVPPALLPADLNESTEGRLVRVNGCLFNSGSTQFDPGTRAFTCSGQTGLVYLRSGHPLVGTIVPTGPVDLVGIVSQYAQSDPPVGGYQLLLRTAADLITNSGITVISRVTQSNILPTGFTLAWNTNLAGSSGVRYGVTPAMSSWNTMPANSTSHAITLVDLEPATAYHARTFSVLGMDTAWSAPGIYSTASADPGEIIVYFNRSVDNSVANGPLAIDLGSAYDDTIRAYIDRSEISLDIAVYNTSNSAIVGAVNDAFERGVQVRWITEGTQNNSALAGLDPSIPVLQRTLPGGSGMHNKFVIIDADGGAAAHVLTGSSNFTNAGLLWDANNLVIVRDMALARAYRAEFEEMWGGPGASPNMSNSRFGPDKTDNTPHEFIIGGVPVQSWFSPGDGTTNRIAEALHSANERIEFALFALTSSTLTYALTDMAAEPGILVRGILEEDDMSTWNYGTLLSAGVDVRPDGDPNHLHHKYAIVDPVPPGSDPLVITGSFNWSFNAEQQNDENTLIIHDAGIADQFHQEWMARWSTAVGIQEVMTGSHALRIWPNPATEDLWVMWSGPSGNGTYRILDPSGRPLVSGILKEGPNALHIGDLPAGHHVLYVVTKEGTASCPLIRLP